MSIGNVVSSIWRPTAPLTPSTAQKPGAPATPPTPPQATQATQTTSLSGPTDPFQQLSADIQAKLLQLQATGSDTTQASTASGKAAKPHHHAHGTDPDADGSLVPTGATTTAGAAPAAGTNPADTSMIDAMRQAIQAYAASASSGSASLTAPLATA